MYPVSIGLGHWIHEPLLTSCLEIEHWNCQQMVRGAYDQVNFPWNKNLLSLWKWSRPRWLFHETRCSSEAIRRRPKLQKMAMMENRRSVRRLLHLSPQGSFWSLFCLDSSWRRFGEWAKLTLKASDKLLTQTQPHSISMKRYYTISLGIWSHYCFLIYFQSRKVHIEFFLFTPVNTQ